MQLYILPITETAKIPNEYCRKYFPERFEKSKRFVKTEDRFRSIGAGALIHRVMNADEKDIRAGENGKPYIEGADVHFNLSHSGGYTVLAVDSSPLGVDIEIVEEHHIDVAKTVFTADELAFMEEDRENRFFWLWTLKESVVKNTGRGISAGLQSFSVMNMVNKQPLVLNGTSFYGESTFFDGHWLSVVSNHKINSMNTAFVSAAMIIN